MIHLVLGCAGFLFYYIYDFNTVFFHIPVFTRGFTMGSLLLGLTTLHLIYRSVHMTAFTVLSMFWLIASGLFLCLLIYTLFFALPVKEAYSGQSAEGRRVCRSGMYALCRHPGVLWLAGFYFCLAAAFGTKLFWSAAVLFTALDFFYILIQDLIIFPRQFTDYSDYRLTTPFLIPDPGSLRRACQTWRKEDSHEV